MASEIVITGISGRFPESDNVQEFSDNLYNKVDLLTENNKRWEPGLYGLPRRMGTMKDISKFDNQFFGVHHKQAHMLDPQARILLELTHESIVDAGYDPEELRGRNIGVFIGNCSSESDEFFCYDAKKINGYAMTGCCRAMFANRISYTFDFKGPSFLIDTACSSGALALYEAVKAIQNDECEAAIVGGANLCLRPGTALQFYRLNMLSDDGKCKSFDAAGNGYGRSEAIVTLLLQKADVARRNYASVVHVKTNTDGFKEQGVTFPSAAMQKRLIQEVYEESKLNPLKISYVEAHGTGTPAGDPIEMSAIADIFCSGRSEPLLVGSVKSNMGHSEPTSGLCSVVKVLIGMEKGLIPPNLHFQNPNPNIPALLDGRVKIVSNPVPWNGGYAALSCFGFGGVNVHAILKSNDIEPKKITEESAIPQLVLYGGRTEEAVQYLFDHLEQLPEKPQREFFSLFHKSVYTPSQAKPFRGYKLLTNGEDALASIKQVELEKRPLWYIFSGMGTQWPAMAKQLMHLEIFANSIKKSAEVLRPHGLDLIDLVTNGVKDGGNARSIIPAFVSIAAVQVALVDVLNAIGMKPDGVVGHSVGELGCAYADGSFTAEQMVLAAFWRGKAVEEAKLTEGAMAALGLTWAEAKKCCPEDIFPSCHNAEDSVTISGPKANVKKFVDKLKAENVFAREVDSCGYAFHSKYIHPAAGRLQAALEKVIPAPKQRSSCWVSSSYPEAEWGLPESKIAGASYFVHNLVSPVLFHEALHHVPKNAVVVEIAPHHLLQAILKRVIGSGAEYIGLMKRNTDNSVHLLTSLGKLYTSGLNPDIERLYPAVTHPVPRTTPMISPLIRWDHSESWTVAKWDRDTNQQQMITEVNVGPDESPDHYLLGHGIDGRCLYPATAYLLLAWRALAELRGREMTETPVHFEEVKLHRATVLSKAASTKFLVDITTAGGEFEISEGGATVCTGRAYTPEKIENNDYLNAWKQKSQTIELNANDIYKELKLRGYDYGPTFQGVAGSDIEGNLGLLKWTGDWVVFLDTMLQFTIMGTPKRILALPTRIQSMKIDPVYHLKFMEQMTAEFNGVPVIHDKETRQCISGGVELKNLKASFAPKNQGKQVPLLEEYRFIPYDEPSSLAKHEQETLEKYASVCLSVAKSILQHSGKGKDQIATVLNKSAELDKAVVSNYLKSPQPENHVLLKSLLAIEAATTSNGKDLSKHISGHVGKYLTERSADVLSRSLTQESPLRTIVDVVLENVTSRKLKVAEVSDSAVPLSVDINELILTMGVLNVNYSIAHTNEEAIQKERLTSGNFSVSSWKPSEALKFQDIDMFVTKYYSSDKTTFQNLLQNAVNALKDDGFIVAIARTKLIAAEAFLSAVSETPIPVLSETDVEEVFSNLKVQVIAKKSDSVASTIYLVRKSVNTNFEETIVPIVVDKYESWVDNLRERLSEAGEGKRFWLVSEGSPNSGIIGLVNCLRQEPGGSSIRCVFIGKDASNLKAFNVKNGAFKDVIEKNLVMNVYKNGLWGSYRHIKMTENLTRTLTTHAYLNVLTRGDLSSLVWVDSPLKHFSPSSESVLCQVYYAPLNFRDIMLATGKLPPDAIPGDLAMQDCILGLEFSGRLMDGSRVMGLVPAKGLATTVAADPYFVWKVPSDWTLEQAATVPVAYSTAYYALIIRGNLKKGEKVLIHSGSGGVGQAAIAIALSLECEVYTTVGSSEKREFLKKRFPVLTDKNFCNSRDTSFEQYILKATGGEGVDVILNSLADEKLKATLNCLAQHGRFLEIGKYDLSNNSPLGMAIFLKNISFHGILLDALFESKSYSGRAKKEVVRLVSEGIANGTVQPLNSILFDQDQAEQAFRYMASGRHIGKVVLKIKEEESTPKIKPTPTTLNAMTRTTCDPKKSYLVIGGLGGFGLELAQWLVERGARNIVLTSRSGVKSGYQKLCVDRWLKDNINIVVSTYNVAKSDEAIKLLKLTAEQGEVAGIFNLALVLRDAFMENQTVENFVQVCESKVQSTYNLDLLSRSICPKLDWFVCFSSVSCGRGNAGQSNYGYANSVMERICEERVKQGLPGLAIQWGAIGDVGVIQDTVGSDVVIGGTVPQRIFSCLSVLDKFLQQDHPVVSSFVPYRPSEASSQKSSKNNVLATVGNIFGIKDMTTLNPETSLGELGMDSLMGVEVKQFLERDFDLVLGIPELRQLKVKDLKNLESGAGSGDAEAQQKTQETSEKMPGHFGSLQSEQLVPKTSVVKMNSVSAGVPLVVVHPIEGVVAMLGALAQSLPVPVYGLQFTEDAAAESLETLAHWYWKQLESLNVDSVHLSGYSFGASVAFEMALQADRDPHPRISVRSLVLLDGSPALVTAYTREHESHFSGETSQVEGEAEALCSFALQFADIDLRELKKELMALSSFEERMKCAANKIASACKGLRHSDLASASELYYKKLLASLKYTPRYKLRRDLTLIKASESVDMTKVFSEQYDLEKVCGGKISTHVVEGTHNTFIQGKGAKEVSNLLSEILSR